MKNLHQKNNFMPVDLRNCSLTNVTHLNWGSLLQGETYNHNHSNQF